MFFINNDINKIINKYLDIKNILLFRQTNKKNIFIILENFNYIRKINNFIKENTINENDKYKIELIISKYIFSDIIIKNYKNDKILNNIYNIKKTIRDKVSYLSINNYKYYKKEDLFKIISFLKYKILDSNIFSNLKNLKCDILIFIYLFKNKDIYIKLECVVINVLYISKQKTNLLLMKINELFLEKNIICNKVIYFNYTEYFKEKMLEEKNNLNIKFLFSNN